MSYDLSELEKKILFDLYDKEINNHFDIKIRPESYTLSEKDSRHRLQELVYYIKKLDRLGYVETEYDFILTGGNPHEKYGNDAIRIKQNKIHITSKGRFFVEEARKTTKDKITEWFRRTSKTILKKMEEKIIFHLISFVFGILFILFICFVFRFF